MLIVTFGQNPFPTNIYMSGLNYMIVSSTQWFHVSVLTQQLMSASYQAKWSICYLSVAPAPGRRRFCTDSRVINMEFYGALSWWRTEANKPPYNQCRLPLTAADINQLTPASQQYWTGHTATQNWSFLPQPQPKPSPDVTAPTHGGMARLSGPQWFKKYWDGRLPKVATNPSTNRARCSL